LKKEFFTKSAEETKNLGQRIAREISGGWVLDLEGDLGAGKTTFTKGVATFFEIKSEITSPTFAIEQLYESDLNLTLAHYDFYRIKGKDPVVYEALEKIGDQNIVAVIEWGEVIKKYLPSKTIYIKFYYGQENQRIISIEGLGDEAKKVVQKL
jgi:tRNA threonylcarbamoyladenosine biosynthesis protein TsaE